jgi:hypothetical protein
MAKISLASDLLRKIALRDNTGHTINIHKAYIQQNIYCIKILQKRTDTFTLLCGGLEGGGGRI